MSVEGPSSLPPAPAQAPSNNNASSSQAVIRKSSAQRFSIATQASPAKTSTAHPKGPQQQHPRKLRVTEGMQTSPPGTVAPKTPTQAKHQAKDKKSHKAPTTARRRNERANESEGEAPHGVLPDTASSSMGGRVHGWSEHSTEEGSKSRGRHQGSSRAAFTAPPLANNGWDEATELWDAPLDVNASGFKPILKVARYDPLAEYNGTAEAKTKVNDDVALAGWGDPIVVTPKAEAAGSSEPLRGADRGGRGAVPGAGRGRDVATTGFHDAPNIAAGTTGRGAGHRAAGAGPTREPWGPQAKAAALAAKRDGSPPVKPRGGDPSGHQFDAASHGARQSKSSGEAAAQERRAAPPAHDAGKASASKGWAAQPPTPSQFKQRTGPPSTGPRARDLLKSANPPKPQVQKKPKVDLTRPVENAPMADPLMSWDGPELDPDPLRVPPAKDKVQAWAASQSAFEQPAPDQDPNEIAPSMESQSNAGSAFQGLSSGISSRYSDDACTEDESVQAMRGMADMTIGGAPANKRLAPWEAKAARNAVTPGAGPRGAPPHWKQDEFEVLNAFDQSGRAGRGTGRGRARGQNFTTGFVGRGRGLPVVGQTSRAFGAPAFALPPHLAAPGQDGAPGNSSPVPRGSSKPVSKASSDVDADGEAGGPRAEAQALVAGGSASGKPSVRLPAAPRADSGVQAKTASKPTLTGTQEKLETASQMDAVAGDEARTGAPEKGDEVASPQEQPTPPPPILKATPSLSLGSILSQIPQGHAIDAEGSIWDLQVVPPARVGSFIIKEQIEIVPAVPRPHIAATAPASTVASKVALATHSPASAPASAIAAAPTGRVPSRLSATSSANPAVFRPRSHFVDGVAGSPAEMAQAWDGAPDQGPTAAIYGAGSTDMNASGGWGDGVAYENAVPSSNVMHHHSMSGNPYASGPGTIDGSHGYLASPGGAIDGMVYYGNTAVAPDGMGGSHYAYGYSEPHAHANAHQAQAGNETYQAYGWTTTSADAAAGWG